MQTSGKERHFASAERLHIKEGRHIELTESSLLTLRTINHEPVSDSSQLQQGQALGCNLLPTTDHRYSKS